MARITGVRVAETVPDAVLERAAEIELIDLTPRSCSRASPRARSTRPIWRAARARASSSPATSPRCASSRCGGRPSAWTTSSSAICAPCAIGRPWRGGESASWRSSAQTGWDPPSCALPTVSPTSCARALRRRHGRGGGKVAFAGGRRERRRGPGARRAARGRVERLVATDLVDEILRFARKGNFTQIFVGRSRSAWWREALRRSLVGALVRRADGVAIHVVSESRPARGPARRPSASNGAARLPYAAGLAAVAGVVGLATIVRDLATTANVARCSSSAR